MTPGATPAHAPTFPIAAPEGWTLDDGATFRVGQPGQYRFPFVALDAEGPASLGRMQWLIELLRGKQGRIGWVLVWAKQTRDPRYQRRLFCLPAHAAALTGSPFGSISDRRDHYLQHVWRTAFCADHKTLIFDAYPATRHTALVVDLWLSTSAEIYFA